MLNNKNLFDQSDIDFYFEERCNFSEKKFY